MRKKEVDYYEEIAKEIVKQFQVNLNDNNYETQCMKIYPYTMPVIINLNGKIYNHIA